MQKEPPSVQVPLVPQVPEQQSPSAWHWLPAVLHESFKVPHAPLTQEPLQHSAPVVHVSVSETQVLLEHLPPTQLKLQQSVAALQASLAAAQTPTTDAHLSDLGSQMPEQHSVLCTHTAPKGLHSGLPLAPPSVLLAPLVPVPSPPSESPAPPLALSPATLLVAP